MKFSNGIAGLFSLAVAFFASTALAQPSSVAFWYADEPPLPELQDRSGRWIAAERIEDAAERRARVAELMEMVVEASSG